MKLVMFCHPDFASSQSMPRFAKMLKASYESRGHQDEVWSPPAKFHQWFLGSRRAKWGGYVDQYLSFPYRVRRALKTTSADTLFVFCDQALGPWMPLVKDRPHVVHVHDLLALRSALGGVPENPTSITRRIYQRYIRPEPNARFKLALSKVPANGWVFFFQKLDNRTLKASYSYARAFLFPSLAEGFGWPLVEAQACGCPVITTDEPPMNEVASDAALYLPRLRADGDVAAWASSGASALQELLSLSAAERERRVQRGRGGGEPVDADRAIEG